jgi:hypothetical protein
MTFSARATYCGSERCSVSVSSQAIYLVVEGDGEEQAVPLLIRRLLYDYLERFEFASIQVFNAQGRGNLTRQGGLERILEKVQRSSDCMGCLILLDAEKEDVRCPLTPVQQLADFAKKRTWPFPIVIVCAVCEYESWFLYNLEAIARDFELSTTSYEGDPESECAAKGWISRQMPPDASYKETFHQVKFTDRIDIVKTAKQSRSFRRLVHAVEELVEAIDNHTTLVSPNFSRA